MDVNTLVQRVPINKDFITLDKSRCNGCGRCTVVCTMALWRKRGKTAQIADDYKTKCLECAACYQVCEPGAIHFSYPPGGTGVVYERG